MNRMSDVDALEPRLLRAFIAVAEELHFGRAAVRLHMTQPPLSVQIRKLEDSVGARLLERSRRHVALTEAGAFFLTRARHLLAEGSRSVAETARIARGEAGVLSVGYTATATYEILPPLVRAFATRAPGVRLELVELRSPLQAEALRSGRIELGLACGPIDEPDILARVLARERLLAILPAKHALARKARLRLADLRDQPSVVVRADIEPAWAHACAAALARSEVRLPIAQETDSKVAMLGLVAAGIGIALGSASMARLARHGVVFREVSDFRLRLSLVALTGPSPSARATAFLPRRIAFPRA